MTDIITQFNTLSWPAAFALVGCVATFFWFIK